ncbi:MAG: Gfo/Idh/MocA family oxidoreductase [Sumerlaeia bacterium]
MSHSNGSSRKIPIGVVGVGHLGQHHARVLAESPNAELLFVCDSDADRAETIAKKHGAKAITNYREMIGHVEAVSIVTPTVYHYDIGTEFLNAGIHCLIEKPICNTVMEAAKLSVLATEKNVVLQVGHIEHFNVAVQKFKQYLKEPLFIECHRLGPFNPRVQDIGVVMDLMIHDIDIILRIVNSEIEDIEAVGANILTDREDIANARIKFKSGCIANVTCSRVTPKPMRKLRVYQENAYISLDYQKQAMEIHRRLQKDGPAKPGESRYFIETERIKVRRKEPLKLELEDFVSCIQKGRAPQTTGVQAMEALDVVIKITELIREKSVPLIEEKLRHHIDEVTAE